MGFGGAHEPLITYVQCLHALRVGHQGVHDCHWVFKAFGILKSLRVTAIHFLKVGKILSSENFH